MKILLKRFIMIVSLLLVLTSCQESIIDDGPVPHVDKYAVYFVSNCDVSIPSQEVIKGEYALRPEISRQGFELDGWFTSNTLEELFLFEVTPVTKSLVLFAGWTELKNNLTVSFDTDGGGTIESIVVERDNTLTPPQEPQKEGFAFIGWYKDKELQNIFNFETIITEDLTLYAAWEEVKANQHTVIFDCDGGSSIPNMVVDDKAKITRPTNPTKAGYTFDNWYKDKALTTLFDFNTEIVENTTIYAKWNVVADVKFTVSFNVGSGGSAVAPQQVSADGVATKPTNPTKVGYVFENWYTEQSYTNVFNFETKITKNITLYAKWTENERFTVTFNTLGGNTIPSQSIIGGLCATNPGNPYKAGYVFGGWFMEQSCQNEFVFTTAITENITLYAKWTESTSNHYPYSGNYYAGIDFINFNATEKSKLLTLLEKQAGQSYSSSNWTPCEKSGVDPNNSSNVILIYSGVSYPISKRVSSDPDGWNKEHIWPQSKMSTSVAGDQQNLFPCNAKINSDRGNMSFVDSSGTYKTVSGAFYPGDEWRGEVARTLMYMAFRYNMQISQVINPSLALRWHEEDPVSQWEMTRNDILYGQNYWKNRNPFVDNPELAFMIYGTQTLSVMEETEIVSILMMFQYEYISFENKYVV